jgi:hypothetical protein
MTSQCLSILAAIVFALATCLGQMVGVPTAQQVSTNHGVIQPCCDESLFDPSRKMALSYRSENLTITLINGKKNLAVDVENRSFKSTGTIDLPSEIVQVNEIQEGPGDRAIVIGMVNGSVFEAVILDTHSIRVVDYFLAYSPSISPDGRFVAFVKFYPAHFAVGTDDHYLLYDVSRSAPENRAANVSSSDHVDVGIPAYPRGINRAADNADVPGVQQHHMMAQAFFWQSDSDRYAFADEYAGGIDLVVISTSGGLPVATKVGISRGEICAALRTETCNVTVVRTELTPTSVIATFRGAGPDSSLQQTLRYRYQQFLSIH